MCFAFVAIASIYPHWNIMKLFSGNLSINLLVSLCDSCALVCLCFCFAYIRVVTKLLNERKVTIQGV